MSEHPLYKFEHCIALRFEADEMAHAERVFDTLVAMLQLAGYQPGFAFVRPTTLPGYFAIGNQAAVDAYCAARGDDERAHFKKTAAVMLPPLHELQKENT